MAVTSGPFVGRSLLFPDVLTRVATGRHVVLYGPAGVGKKTLLVAELCRRAPVVRRRIDRLLGNAGVASFHLSRLASLGLPGDVVPDNLAALVVPPQVAATAHRGRPCAGLA